MVLSYSKRNALQHALQGITLVIAYVMFVTLNVPNVMDPIPTNAFPVLLIKFFNRMDLAITIAYLESMHKIEHANYVAKNVRHAHLLILVLVAETIPILKMVHVLLPVVLEDSVLMECAELDVLLEHSNTIQDV